MRADPNINPAHTLAGTTSGESRHKEYIPVLIGARHAGAMLAIAQRTLSKHTATGAIPSVKLGGARRYIVAEIQEWIKAGCPTEPGAGDAIRQQPGGGEG